MSPRQRASPENLCQSRRRTWASPSSEGESSVSTPGPSYCIGAGQKHNHLHTPGLSSIPSSSILVEDPPIFYSLLPRTQRPRLSRPAPCSPHHRATDHSSHSPYPCLPPHTGPQAGCAERPAGCAAPAPSCPCASGPGRSQPLERAAGSNTHRPTAEDRLEPWSDGNPAQPRNPNPTNAQEDGDQREL